MAEEDKLISHLEMQQIVQARRALKAIAGRAMKRRVAVGHPSDYGRGIVYASAESAEQALFELLNMLNCFADQDVPDDVLFITRKPEGGE